MLDAGNDIIGVNLQMQGPGSVLLTAGRDVTYDGNNRPALGTKVLGLPDGGASIDVIAGLNGRSPDYAVFTAAYLDLANVAAMPAHLTTIVDGQTVPLYLTDDYDGTRTSKQVRFGLVSFIADITGEKLSPLQPGHASRHWR